MACRRWKRSARMVLACHERFKQRETGYWLARFEDAVRDPDAFVHEACRRFDLDPAAYPFDAADDLPVRGSGSLSRPGQVDWAPHTKPADFDPTGHWRDWPPRRLRRFHRLAGPELRALGYTDTV
jgi:hypothetical protein